MRYHSSKSQLFLDILGENLPYTIWILPTTLKEIFSSQWIKSLKCMSMVPW